MPCCCSSAPRKKLPPPTTTATSLPSWTAWAICRATPRTTSGARPTLPPPKTSPDSFSSTRRYERLSAPSVVTCPQGSAAVARSFHTRPGASTRAALWDNRAAMPVTPASPDRPDNPGKAGEPGPFHPPGPARMGGHRGHTPGVRRGRALMQAWVHAGTSMAERFPASSHGWCARPPTRRTGTSLPLRLPRQPRALESSLERRRSALRRGPRGAHPGAPTGRGSTSRASWRSTSCVRRPLGTVAPAAPLKQATSLAAFFPTNLLFTWLLMPLTRSWPWRAVLAMTLLLTPIRTYLCCPSHRLLQPWLSRRR